MMRVALVGYGAMGKMIEQCLSSDDVITGIVSLDKKLSLYDYDEVPEVIIDFSSPANLDMIISYAKEHNVPVVLATTGYTSEQLEKIEELSKTVPTLFSSNYSLGVILMNRIIREITPILKDSFDIEVVEAHHNRKKDAPSGTAKMLIDSINKDNDFNIVYGREGMSKREPLKEVGVHAIRGGSIVGEHTVLYAGEDEILSIKHEALSRKIFANGAVKGARWIQGKKPLRIYNMEDVLFE